MVLVPATAPRAAIAAPTDVPVPVFPAVPGASVVPVVPVPIGQ
ncbi:hypothetical protein ACGFOU_06085 [Streptomyces sp. NPDC048595]